MKWDQRLGAWSKNKPSSFLRGQPEVSHPFKKLETGNAKGCVIGCG